MEKQISLSNLSTFKELADALYAGNLAPAYDATATYALNDLCTHEGQLYKCSTAISTAEAWNAGHWTAVTIPSGLVGKFVKIMKAPASTTLTDEQIQQIKEGVFIDGEFLGFKNPIIFPASSENAGTIMGFGGWEYQYGLEDFAIRRYEINAYKQISTSSYNSFMHFDYANGFVYIKGRQGIRLLSMLITLDADASIKMGTKTVIPALPSDVDTKDYLLTLTGGAGAWKAFVNNLAPEFDSTVTYAENDLVMYQGTLYVCSNVAGHTGAWDAEDFTRIMISEAKQDKMEPMTELEVQRLFRTEYTITGSITNGSLSGDANIWTSETATATIVPDSGYSAPTNITVVGATGVYNSSTGEVELSDATGNVTISGACAPLPNKGDIITLDGGTARYRVIKATGNVIELLALDDVASSAFNSSSVTTEFSDGNTGQKYEDSTLDNYMNSTFYSSLSANVKSAIVQKNVVQSMYEFGTSEISGYDFAINRITSGTRWYKRKGQVSVGNRYCYVLDVDDVAEYLGAGPGNTISGANLNDMFFEQTTAISKYVWLDSADSGSSNNAFGVSGYNGSVDYNGYSNSNVVRPAFQVDLSQVSWNQAN